jgi:hypothetical protein
MNLNSINQKEVFIIKIYNGFLGRDPEPGAINHWITYLKNGNSINQLLECFLSSDEFKLNRKNKLYVPPGHFYSPIVNIDEAKNFVKKNNNIETLPGINVDKIKMFKFWNNLKHLIKSVAFSENKSLENRYFFLNPAFSYSDGIMLSAIVRYYIPKQIIEIGSGYSSVCILDTIDKYFKHEVKVNFLEPYPELLKNLLGGGSINANIKIYNQPVQNVDINLFLELEENDLLFIDSTHVLKTGSDVCHELFNILPVLKKGVIVHFHDIFWPFEYPDDWILKENRSWNEIYALRAFLMNNSEFEILFFNDFFARNFDDEIKIVRPDMLKNTGGSLYLKKIK